MGKKNKKRKPKMPKLSVADKLIYWTALILLLSFSILIVTLPVILFDSIAFSDEDVIASSHKATVFWALVPWFTFFIMTLILWNELYYGRQPLFGIRNFNYGPPKYPKKYPLLRKGNHPNWTSEKKRKSRRSLAWLLLIILLVSFIPYPWAFFGRNSLHYNGTVTEHNVFNSQTEEFTSGQIRSVEFCTYRYDTGGKYSTHWHWSVMMNIQTDSGKEYSFRTGAFASSPEGEPPRWLTEMTQLKRRFDPSIIIYSGINDLDKAVEDLKLNEEETELLYQLFNMS